MTNDTCPHCHRPLIEIDYYGERLIGCIECNRWGRPGDATLPMQLLEDVKKKTEAGWQKPIRAECVWIF